MVIFINNCNHWINYHMIDALLNTGYKVEGLKEGKENEHLLLYFGRNSNFSIAENYKTKDYQHAVSLQVPVAGVNAEYNHVITMDSSPGRDGTYYLQAPLLFGEWMPMNREGMYVNGRFIPFNSEDFIIKSMYIKDFTKVFIDWIDAVNKNRKMGFLSGEDGNKWVKLESYLHLRNNDAMEEQLDQVIEHYNNHKEMYHS